MTKFDGQSNTYDTIGNPTSYYNGTRWTFGWEHGRELATMTSGTKTWTNTYNADGLRTKRTDGSVTFTYYYVGGKLTQVYINSIAVQLIYDADGSPLAVRYNGVMYYYVTNLQGDVVALLDTAGNVVVEYLYDAWGRIISTTGTLATTLGIHNPLRYRGYVYDQETRLYYLQSRYYDPAVGRFINADAIISTDQNLIGSNQFAYCANNPINYVDPTGHKFVGYGFQIDFQAGDISYGVEVVIYTDETVCNGEDYLVCVYNYSGYDISIGDLQKIYDIAEAIASTAVFETHNDDVEAFYSSVTFIFNGLGVSGGGFLLYGDDNSFNDPWDYSGGFETWSASAKIKGATVTGFHSFSETCDAYGFKIGAHWDGLRQTGSNLFGLAYSRSYYSDPYILEFA